MIKLRLDVDYPFPSRLKSFLFTALNLKNSKDYLKNSKIIAEMINESQKEVQAYWFFTPQTIPDNELLQLLHLEKHEIALHVANNPYAELDRLEKATKRRIRYYTVHGTARLLARLMWKRKIWEDKVRIPEGFPLKSFYEVPHSGLDIVCYNRPTAESVRMAELSITRGEALHIHPEWLFQKGIINRRGAFYEPLKQILQVDNDLSTITVRRKLFVRIARHSETKEYERDFFPNEEFTRKLSERGVDLFTFLERSWCSRIPKPPRTWQKIEDNVALMEVTTYPAWLEQIGKKTRNMIRKADKSGIRIEITEPSEALAEGIWKIYNETPIRQGRAFPHYGQSLESVRELVASTKGTFIAAYLQNELVGFIQLVHGDRITIISQILALQKHSDKAVNNDLIAKTVNFCASKGCRWLMYARMGNHPSLDNFKLNNGFRRFEISRYYVPVTQKGHAAMRMGLHKDTKDILPERIKYLLIPVYNWVSRVKIRLKRK